MISFHLWLLIKQLQICPVCATGPHLFYLVVLLKCSRKSRNFISFVFIDVLWSLSVPVVCLIWPLQTSRIKGPSPVIWSVQKNTTCSLDCKVVNTLIRFTLPLLFDQLVSHKLESDLKHDGATILGRQVSYAPFANKQYPCADQSIKPKATRTSKNTLIDISMNESKLGRLLANLHFLRIVQSTRDDGCWQS